MISYGRKFIVLVLLVFALAVQGSTHANLVLQKAQDLFIQVDCKGPHSEPYAMGSAFPFGEHFIFTARHIECPDGQQLLVSKDGSTWFAVDEAKNFAHPALDIRALVVDGVSFKTVASFREPVIGEDVTGFGAAVDIISTFGRVMKLLPEQGLILASNAPLGGMSGSALVADDGMVIGMTVFGYHDGRVGGAVTGAISGAMLKELAESFPAFYAGATNTEAK